MRIFKIILLLEVITILCLSCTQIESTSKPGEEVKTGFDTEKWVGLWLKFWNTYDLNEVDKLFVQDDRLTYFSSEKEGIFYGIDAVREHHIGFGFVPGGKTQENKLWLEDLRTTDLGDTVIITGIWHFQRPTGRKQHGSVTLVYLQQREEYRLVHLNFGNYPDEKKEE